MIRAMKIALIAHDHKKDDMVALAQEFSAFLRRCQLMATGTTGGRLRNEAALEVECLLSGPLGGDLQIGARLSAGEVDAVVFLRDPMTPQPHEPDINALVRACDVHNVACATNLATARHLLRALAEAPQDDEAAPTPAVAFQRSGVSTSTP
jgi:methylglyoxal synthase